VLDVVIGETPLDAGPGSPASVILDNAQYMVGAYGIGRCVAEVQGTPAERALCIRTVLTGQPYRVMHGRIDRVIEVPNESATRSMRILRKYRTGSAQVASLASSAPASRNAPTPKSAVVFVVTGWLLLGRSPGP
jgi:hypothetical protein